MKEFTVNELKLIKRSIFTELCRLDDIHSTDTETIESLERLYDDVLKEYKAKKQQQN